MLQQWMITVGILVAYIVALIIFAAWPASAAAVGWRRARPGAVAALVGWSADPDARVAAVAVAARPVRGRAEAMAALGTEADGRPPGRGGHREGGEATWARRPGRRGCAGPDRGGGVFFIFRQITGINGALYYGPHLLGPIFSGAHANLVADHGGRGRGHRDHDRVNVASTYLGFRWIDKFGRRKLAIGGYTGMIVFALVAALGLVATSGTLRLVVIMIGLDFFIASFADQALAASAGRCRARCSPPRCAARPRRSAP